MAVQLGLVRCDLTGQVRLGFGEPMRTVRDPPDHRPTGLGPSATSQGRLLAFLFRAFAPPRLFGNLLRGLADPHCPMAAIPQPCRQPLPITVVARACGGGRNVFGGVQSLRLSNELADLSLQPFLATVGLNRCVGGNLGAIDRNRSQARQARLGRDQQHLCEQRREGVLVLGAEPCDRRVIRGVLGTQHAEGHVGQAPTLDLPRGSHTLAVGIDQQC
ncbi:MAG TPA: hypothetical protein VHN18_06425, partial [Micromonosporaceae bacterium]|nr:hypothetical protein [Micromonosporaceae bacterium]